MILADSNLFIYAVLPGEQRLSTWIAGHLPKVSVISLVEVLGFHRLGSRDQVRLETLFSKLDTIYPEPSTFNVAIGLRQQRKMSLGDALIAATCLENQFSLATHNTRDFDWIEQLTVIDPLTN